jgi:hypothetical protein
MEVANIQTIAALETILPPATTEPRAITANPQNQADASVTPPAPLRARPTARGPRKPLVNPISPKSARAAARVSGAAAATTPPLRAPASP